MLINPPIWTQNGRYTAEHDRRLIGGLVRSEGVADTTSMRATAVSNSRQVSIGAGGAYINGDYDQAGGGGMYFGYNDGAHEVAIPVPGSSARYDLIVLRVYDSAVSGSTNEVRFDVITGTESTSPRIPAVPRSAIAICAVRTAPGATVVRDIDIADQRTVAQLNGGVTGNVDYTQQTKLNQVASPSNPILITRDNDPNTLQLSTGGGFQTIGGSQVYYQESEVPRSAPEGTIATSRAAGRTYQMRDGKWRFFAGWGPNITVGRTLDHYSYLGPYLGGVALNTGNTTGWGDETPRSSSDYATYFSVTGGSSGTSISRAGGVTLRIPGMYHVEYRYQVRTTRAGTAVRSRIAGPGIGHFTAADNMEQYTVIQGRNEEHTFSNSSTISVTNTNKSTHGKIIPWLRTSSPVRMMTFIMKIELLYEF